MMDIRRYHLPIKHIRLQKKLPLFSFLLLAKKVELNIWVDYMGSLNRYISKSMDHYTPRFTRIHF